MSTLLHPALAQAHQAEVVRSLPRRRLLAELRARRVRRAGRGRHGAPAPRGIPTGARHAAVR